MQDHLFSPVVCNVVVELRINTHLYVSAYLYEIVAFRGVYFLKELDIPLLLLLSVYRRRRRRLKLSNFPLRLGPFSISSTFVSEALDFNKLYVAWVRVSGMILIIWEAVTNLIMIY